MSTPHPPALQRRSTLKQPSMRYDPRIRQTLDNLTSTLEAAADTARTGCFTFTKTYLEPCLSTLAGCCSSCLSPPQPTHNHHRYNPAHRSEYPFGFYVYDDYADDSEDGGGGGASGGFLAWGTDELDRLLAGSGGSQAPRERERMYYGAVDVGARRKAAEELDPTVIPSTSMFGFLSRFGVRGRGMRYKPSAANLQEHPQRGGGSGEGWYGSISGRKRSGTGSSAASQGESLRSRGDLWPSEDEDDAVVIGDDVFVGVEQGSGGVGSDGGYDTYGDYDEDADAGEVDLLLRREEREEEERRRRKREFERRREIQRGKTVVCATPHSHRPY